MPILRFSEFKKACFIGKTDRKIIFYNANIIKYAREFSLSSFFNNMKCYVYVNAL